MTQRMTRRQVLKTAGAAGVAATTPWWLARKAHAQRAKKLVFWAIPNFTPLADQLQKEQFYEFAKQAGLKEADVEYAVVANEGMQDKLAAASLALACSLATTSYSTSLSLSPALFAKA